MIAVRDVTMLQTCFARASARSLPMIPVWPSTHLTFSDPGFMPLALSICVHFLRSVSKTKIRVELEGVHCPDMSSDVDDFCTGIGPFARVIGQLSFLRFDSILGDYQIYLPDPYYSQHIRFGLRSLVSRK